MSAAFLPIRALAMRMQLAQDALPERHPVLDQQPVLIGMKPDHYLYSLPTRAMR
jgi:hypothetical protein